MNESNLVSPSEHLGRLGRDYRRLAQTRTRARPRSAARRRYGRRMARIAARFERLLERWVKDAAEQQAWRRFLYHGGSAPGARLFGVPPLYRGRTADGTLLEVRPATGGAYDLFVDGALAAREEAPWQLDPDTMAPIHIGGRSCREVFDAPESAVRELAEFLRTPGQEPPWAWARELVEDGLVDADFALTPRGARCLHARKTRRAEVPARSACVVVADAGRARILVLDSDVEESGPTAAPLVQVADVRMPIMRARDHQLFSDSRPGLRREGGHGPRHGVSDRRNGHRRELRRQLARRVVEAAASVWDERPGCRVVIAASPSLLGSLRPVLAQKLGAAARDVRDCARDLTHLPPAALHDALAAADLLPPRARFAGPQAVT